MGKRVKTAEQKERDRVLSKLRKKRLADDPEWRAREAERSRVSIFNQDFYV